MAIAFDAFSSVAAGTGTLSWTHTPVGTPGAIIVTIVAAVSADEVSGVTYGGVAMTREAADASVGEAGSYYVYRLYSGIPTGAQTVQVSVSGASSKRAGAYSLTGSGITLLGGNTFNSASTANPSSTLALGGVTSWVGGTFFSGQAAVTGITPFASWTADLEHDFGASVSGWYRYNTVSNADVTVGWTQTADDAVGVFYAFYEAAVPGAMSGSTSPTFSTSGTLTGSGALSGSSAPTFSTSGTLRGLAPVTGATTLTFSTSGTATATAAISGASSLTFSTAGALTGSGALSGASTLTFSPSAALVGSGALSGASSLTFAATATATGIAPVSGASSLAFSTSGTLAGRANASGAANLAFSTSGALAGRGAASGATSLTFTPSASLTGSGAVSGASSLTFSTAGNLQGSAPGDLSGTTTLFFTVSGTLGGAGALSGSTSLTFDTSGSLAAPSGTSAQGGVHIRKRRRKTYTYIPDTIRDVLEQEQERVEALPEPPQPSKRRKRKLAKQVIIAAGKPELLPLLPQFEPLVLRIGNEVIESAADRQARAEAHYQAIMRLIAEMEQRKAIEDEDDEDDLEQMLLAA